MSASPTSRTINYLDAMGIRAGNVERYVHQVRKRYDLFGFLDVIACYPDCIAGLQITSTSNRSARVKKICGERKQEALDFLASNGHIEVWGWSKKGKAGKRKLWTPSVCQITATPKGELIVAEIPAPDIFPRQKKRICKRLQKSKKAVA